ncbi:MAG: DNA mismatch repair protein MutS [Phycisphaerales bacterium]
MPDPRDTPAMRQFTRFKQRHPDCILLFRIGDFYETFDDDAVTCHKALGLTLTQRTEGIPMAGVPHHQLENYLRRLIQQGYRVAVCDQVQDAKEAKGIVERAVTRVITPGTRVEDSLLDESAASRLAALAPADLRDPTRLGLAAVEVSTGAFTVFETSAAALADALAARGIDELIFPEQPGLAGKLPPALARAAEVHGISCTPRPAWHFRPAEALEAVRQQFGVATVAGFGLRDDELAVCAAGAIIRYLLETQTPTEDSAGATGVPSSARPCTGTPARQRPTLAHLLPPRREEDGAVCILDGVSLRALEVERTIRTPHGRTAAGAADGSLVGLFLSSPGGCRTPMGKRLLREWLCRPSLRLDEVRSRHARVALLVEDRRTAKALAEALDGVQDVARIGGRIALRRATPRDLVALGRSLARVETLAAVIHSAPAFAVSLRALESVREQLAPVARRILDACIDSPPQHLREGGLFRDGFDAALDEARLLQRDAASWLAAYQQRLSAEHKLPGLKVGFNKVFGYYIELPAAQARQAPGALTRKQTLKNAERYTTPELEEFQEKVTTAESRAVERERLLFDGLCDEAGAVLPAIAAFAQCVAELDTLACFAERALRRRWVRPEMTDEPVLSITAGRHPVLEEVLGDRFVPNDVQLGGARQRDSETATEGESGAAGGSSPDSLSRCLAASLALITGPNMAGKSTFIRQTALIVLLAHAGSFVPAEAATIGLTDRIFTRVGADDALHAGQSTFMVEMTETATILNSATARSLVILDEIGRGTSTLDGLSLAWAIAEHLVGPESRPPAGETGAPQGPRTLFATHYHELTELEDRLPGRIRNLHVSVREWGEQIVFLHRILPGRTDRSYGVHVAKLAGIPAPVVARAREVLASLAVHHSVGQASRPAGSPGAAAAIPPPSPAGNGQLGLFTEFLPHPAVDRLREIKLDTLSPIQAFDTLRGLKQLLDEP